MKRRIVWILIAMAMMMAMCSCTAGMGDPMESNEGKALDSALVDNNYQGVLDIVETDAKYAAVKLDGETPLRWAAYNGNMDLCKYLMDKGAEPEGAVLMEIEDPDMLKFLIENGADVNAEEDGTSILGALLSPMSVFTENDLGEAADVLLEAGARMDSESFDYLVETAADCSRVQSLVKDHGYGEGMDSVLKSAILGNSEALMKVESAPEESGTVAQYAASFCTLDAIRHLEDVGFDFSYTDDMDCNGTVALAAEYNPDYEVVEYLFKKYGEDSAMTDLDYDLSPFGIAAAAGNFDVADHLEKEYRESWDACAACGAEGSVEYLMGSGYEPDDKEIRRAFREGNRSCIEYLMKNEGYIEVLKDASETVQDEAMYNAGSRDSRWYEVLFEAGIRPGEYSLEQIIGGRDIRLGKKIADRYMDSEYIYDIFIASIDRGCMEMVEYLTEKGVDVNRTIHDNDQDPPEFSLIHVAAQNPSAAVLQYLMDNGADVKAEDKNGDTALEWAEYAECSMNIEVLKSSQK